MKKIMLTGLLVVIVLTSCGTVTEKENNTITENNTEKENNVNIDENSEMSDIDTRKEVLLDLNTYSLQNAGSKSGQPEILFNRAAISGLGIYYWDWSSNDGKEKLMFFDKAFQTSVVLCNRPNCTHSDDTCNAAFGAYSASGTFFYRDMIFYYDESVFLVGDDEESFVNLYRVAADGSSWEKYMTLFKAEKTVTTDDTGTSTFWRLPNICIHKDYVYYIDNSESVQKLRRIPMGGKETEVVYEPQGEKTLVYRMRAHGDFLFFQSGKYVGETLVAGIYAYNTKTDEVSLVKKDALRDYSVVEDSLYYEMNEKIYKYNLKTGEDVELPIINTSTNRTFFANEKGIYFFDENNGILEVFDDDGNLIESIHDTDIEICYFGADGFFFGESSKLQKVFLDEKALHSGNGKWIYGQ